MKPKRQPNRSTNLAEAQAQAENVSDNFHRPQLGVFLRSLLRYVNIRGERPRRDIAKECRAAQLTDGDGEYDAAQIGQGHREGRQTHRDLYEAV